MEGLRAKGACGTNPGLSSKVKESRVPMLKHRRKGKSQETKRKGKRKRRGRRWRERKRDRERALPVFVLFEQAKFQ